MSIRLTSSQMIHTAGMFRAILNAGRFDQLDAAGQKLSSRLYCLSGMFPSLPAGILLGIAEGTTSWSVEGEDVIVDADIPARPIDTATLASFVARRDAIAQDGGRSNYEMIMERNDLIRDLLTALGVPEVTS